MRLSSLSGVALLVAMTVGAPGAASAESAAPTVAAEGGSRAAWQRRAEAYEMEARFYRAAGKPAAAFLARRAAALGEAYRQRALTGSGVGN